MRAFEHFPNLVTMFFARAAEKGDAPFLWRKQAGEWRSLSWTETARQVAALAEALKANGLCRGDTVMLVSENRPEFCIADLAIMAAGGVTVPTYTTNSTRDHQHILDDSAAKAVIVSTAKLARTLLPAVLRSRANLVVSMEPIRPIQGGAVQFLEWDQMIAGQPGDITACATQATQLHRDDLACLIYTSGTGGAPRGVMQHHGSILHNIDGCIDIIAGDFGWEEEVFLSFLPLSHAYEHTGGQFFPIGLGGQIYYAEGLEKLASNMEEARPTIMIVVPRLFEVLRARMLKAVEKQGPTAAYLLRQALRIGAKSYAGRLSFWDRPMQLLVKRTICPKIQQRFGGRMKALVSGGAPLNPEVGIFFHSLGLTLLQGYGQTEAGPVVSCNRPSVGLKMDTVGPPLKNTAIAIAEDGEILVRGELVMKGYWRNERETDRALADGWLHTGDIGVVDEKGRIKITDRKKDIIVNDKGENVAPQKIEGMLTLQPEIGQAMVWGDQRPHLVGIIVPDAEWMKEWAKTNGHLHDEAALKADPAFQAAVRVAVDEVNKDLPVTEKVRRFIFADEPFSIENQEMTPSMKIRRHVIRARYAERLDALYRG